MSDFKKEYELWDEFLRVWPLARLATMTVDDYTQAGSKDSLPIGLSRGWASWAAYGAARRSNSACSRARTPTTKRVMPS